MIKSNTIKRKLLPLFSPLIKGARCLFLKQDRKPVNLTIVPQAIHFRKDSYLGKRCFIIGGGPSINEMNLNLLRLDYCLTVNRGFLLREQGIQNVEFYGLSDYGAHKEYGHLIPNDFAKNICIFGSIPWKRKDINNISSFPMYTDIAREKFMSNGFFQFDLTQPVAHTYTIALQMLQVAVYAGFKDIYFIGIDNDFSGPNMHFYKDSMREKTSMQDWGFNPCEDNEKAFAAAFKILKQQNINIYNAGIGGKLNALPRVDYKDLFK